LCGLLPKIAYQLSALLLRGQEVSDSVLGPKTGSNDRGKYMGFPKQIVQNQ